MKSQSLILIIALLGLLTLSCGSSSDTPTCNPVLRSIMLANETVGIAAAGWSTTQVNVGFSMYNPHVRGSFSASGGSGNDIVVLVLNETDYVNWYNGHPVTPLYNSTKLTTASYNVVLTSGATYWVVYDNRFSSVTAKNVATRVNLDYEQ